MLFLYSAIKEQDLNKKFQEHYKLGDYIYKKNLSFCRNKYYFQTIMDCVEGKIQLIQRDINLYENHMNSKLNNFKKLKSSFENRVNKMEFKIAELENNNKFLKIIITFMSISLILFYSLHFFIKKKNIHSELKISEKSEIDKQETINEQIQSN